ncbi:hypothetical protein D3C80_1977290 [compost metagenome]
MLKLYVHIVTQILAYYNLLAHMYKYKANLYVYLTSCIDKCTNKKYTGAVKGKRLLFIVKIITGWLREE